MKKQFMFPAAVVASLLVSQQAFSLQYQWPYTDYVEVEQYTTGENGQWWFSLHQSTMTINDDAISTYNTVGKVFDEIKKIPKTGLSSRYVGFFYVNSVGHYGPGEIYPLALLTFEKSMEFKEMAKQVTAKYGSGIHTFKHPYKDKSTLCIGTMMANGTFNGPLGLNSFLSTYAWNADIAHGQDLCVMTLPSEDWCAMTTPSLTLDYNSLKLADAEGATVTSSVNTYCTAGMKYTLRLRNSGGIPLSNGMTAELTANDQKLNTALTGKAGQNTVKITSTLTGKPNRTGAFEGSAVMLVSYP